MSSPTSHSPTRSPRTPLNEKSNSDTNRLGIRIVPYSPPRPDPEDGDGDGDGNGDEGETRSNESRSEPSNDDDTASSTPTRPGNLPRTREVRASTVSSSSPPFTPTRVRGKTVSGVSLVSESSGSQHTAPPTLVGKSSYESNIRHVNVPSQSSLNEEGPLSSASKRPMSRRANVINVHSDKTFSVVLKPTGLRNSGRSGSSTKTPSFSNTSTITSQPSFDATTDDRPSSPLSSVPERSVSSFTSGSSSATTKQLIEDQSSASPWNYRMVGGLRKVPNTPDLKPKGKEKEVVSALPALSERSIESPEPVSPLTTKKSFATEQSVSTIEETTNYKIIGRSSPPVPDSDSVKVPSSSGGSNYKVLGHTSPPYPYNSSPEQGPADTPAGKNVVVFDDPSPASSFATFAKRPRPFSSDDSLSLDIRERYSQESLVIRPLRPRKGSASERTGFYRHESGESLRGESLRGRSNSLSSISSIISQGTATLVPTPNLIRLHPTPAAPPRPHSSWAGPSNIAPLRPRMDVHQWSSQLSTVMSEYEGSEGGSRARSSRGFGSLSEQGSSAPGSRGSRALLSVSSSVGDNLDQFISHTRSHSRTDSIERPSPAFMRGARELPSPPIRMVRDHDEHGDGLADLQQLHQLQTKSSRTRMSRQPSDLSLRSTRSSRSRAGSFTTTAIPTWARLYYGSGERRWLAAPSVISEGGDSRPGSSWAPSGSPGQDFEQHIHNPRRRPKEVHPSDPLPGSIEAIPAGADIPRRPKKKTSSIWSPHLRLDRRASGYSIWDPPSATWSADTRMFGKRNIQVLFFAVGFGIPFAWIIAAFLPLPAKPIPTIPERDVSTAELGIPEEAKIEPFRRQPMPVDDINYQSARWWRNLNRFMAIVGLLILGAVAALVVIGVRQKWGR
ncbi:hypothetical protein F5X96DRAFT_670241 [Biscogniauxia mediterranea]|nr:hypothetical protein F5X96DRAFT_670241 [Biscogniauxia mediterranea]